MTNVLEEMVPAHVHMVIIILYTDSSLNVQDGLFSDQQNDK